MDRLDIVIFGASGYTGKFAVEEIHRISKNEKDITWGIAGRSRAKLEDILKNLEEKTGDNLSHIKVIIADVSDAQSLSEMAAQCKVVINCCGPYRFYGEQVVKACVENATHHLDVSGEPAFMESMQVKYDEKAKKAQVYVISACGFDCLPVDLGVVYLQQNFKGHVNSIETLVRIYSPEASKQSGGMFNYATWESLINGLHKMGELKNIRKQIYTTPPPTLLPKFKQRSYIHKNEIDNNWYLPFFGADRSVINRTQTFLYKNDGERPAQVHSYISTPSLWTSLASIFSGIVIMTLSKYSCGKDMLLKHPKFFTFGMVTREPPMEDYVRTLKFDVQVTGEGWQNTPISIGNAPNTRMRIQVTGSSPSYGTTSITAIYSAITILREKHLMPQTFGVLTPGAAFAKTSLVEKLNQNNVNFKVVEVTPIKSKL